MPRPSKMEVHGNYLAYEVARYKEKRPGETTKPLWGSSFDIKAQRERLEKLSLIDRAEATALKRNYYRDLSVPIKDILHAYTSMLPIPIPEDETLEHAQNDEQAHRDHRESVRTEGTLDVFKAEDGDRIGVKFKLPRADGEGKSQGYYHTVTFVPLAAGLGQYCSCNPLSFAPRPHALERGQ